MSKKLFFNIEPKKSEKTLNDNNFNILLNKFENLENQIKDVKSKIKSLGNIFQKYFESFSKLIIEIIKGKTQIKQDDIKNNELQNSILNKNEKFDLENNELIYYTYSEKRKSKYVQVRNNESADFSFSFENGSRKENNQEASSKNANKEVENSIRKKYKIKKEGINKK